MSNRPYIDLTGCHYDDLETALTNYLGLKVILVKDWETPEVLEKAKADLLFAQLERDPSKTNVMEQVVAAAESSVSASLRANIAARDPFVGVELTENDLRSLRTCGHVTLRKGNTEPEEAVIIFDPAVGNKNALLRKFLSGFSLREGVVNNAWDSLATHGKSEEMTPADFVENFDISADDYRAYTAALNVRYALQNQSEYNNTGKAWPGAPFHYLFTGNAVVDDSTGGIWQQTYGMTLEQVANKTALETDFGYDFEELGIKDPSFLKKVLLAGAVMNLITSSSSQDPFDTFSRQEAHHTGSTSAAEIIRIQKDLHERLTKKMESHRTGNMEYCYSMDSRGLDDWRILFPVFREVYEEDTSTGAQRRYYDTIMEGLQKWFPTLTNGPVPELDPAKEPPRSLGKAKAAPPAAAPRSNTPKL